MDELIKKGAVELSRLIKNGSTSSEEVVKAHLKRIKEVNQEINAITISFEESALELAVKSDNASKEDKARPLHGVPFTIKENIDFLDSPTTNGLPFFGNQESEFISAFQRSVILASILVSYSDTNSLILPALYI